MIKNYLKIKHLFIILLSILISTLSIGCNLFVNNSNKSNQINPNEMVVHYIDVGQGDSILIQVNNKNLLIDAGPQSDKKNLLSYLSALNLEKLDYVIATHPHEDHIGNMDDVINDYNVLAFYAPKVQSTTKTFEKMVESLKSKNLKINVIKKVPILLI